MNFDKQHYIHLVTKNKIDEAMKYKNSNIPKTLFKFVHLGYIQECSYKESCPSLILNDTKINAIGNGKLWLSTYNSLNDPFELNALYLNEQLLKSQNYSIDLAKKLLELMKSFLIGSLTTNIKDSMPMWAHYANNHRGFCIEFEIENPQYIFPVLYENDRIAIANIITTHLLAMEKLFSGERLNEKELKDIEVSNIALFHSFLIKDKSWEYEDEYRLLVPEENLNEKGSLCPLTLLGLKIKNIYLGMNCEEKYVNKIKEIAERKGFGIKQMYFDSMSKVFALNYKDI